jgi:hypothetical protein
VSTAVAAWIQGLSVVLTGALPGFIVGGLAGALIGGAVSAPFAVAYGRAVAQGCPYQGSRLGLRRCVIDCTWSSLNTWAGAVYYGVHRLAGNTLDPSRSRGQGSLWLVKGVVPRYATTIGTVKAGSNDRRDRHEQIHVLQARLFGPLYLPLVGLNYVIATILPYWLLFRDREARPITGVWSYFENGVYPHVWNELWAYGATRADKAAVR